MDAVAAANDTPIQMINTSIVRVDQHGVCITRNRVQSMGLSRHAATGSEAAGIERVCSRRRYLYPRHGASRTLAR